jgi:uncharacterized damage-inducible protein DinB
MTFRESFIQELEAESKTTRKMLERVPAEKFAWKPHPKSMSLQQLATHIAEIPEWIELVLNTKELDFATAPYNPASINSNDELIGHFEKAYAKGKAALEKAQDQQLEENWTMRTGEQIHFTATKREMIRTCFCQVVHHRAQLGVDLRLLDIPIPGSYGPSADEMNF